MSLSDRVDEWPIWNEAPLPELMALNGFEARIDDERGIVAIWDPQRSKHVSIKLDSDDDREKLVTIAVGMLRRIGIGG
jgi:hypothetical protein